MDENVNLVNECEYSQERLADAYRATRKTPRFIFWIVILLVCAAFFAAEAVKVVRNRAYMPLWLVILCPLLALVYVGFICYHVFFAPKVAAKRSERRSRELSGGEPPRQLASFSEHEVTFHTEKPLTELSLGYDVFKTVIERKSQIILCTKQKRMILLDKNGFQNGTVEDFWKLIAEKCPEAKLKRL